MANFTESLTIRILGDSSNLQRALDGVTRRLSDLQTRLSRMGDVEQQIGRTVGRFSRMARPLDEVSRLLDHIAGQARLLGRIPINLNVAPAVNSLNVLSRLIDQIAVKARLLSIGGIGGVPSPAGGRVARFADGGLVSGANGIDRVPALLTAGEFVIRQPVVQQLGSSFLNALNQNLRGVVPRGVPATAPSAGPPAVNNFGGISINVMQSADVNAIVRDLRFQGIRLRNRRG